MNTILYNKMSDNIDKFIYEIKDNLDLFITREKKDILDKISQDYNLDKIELYKKYLDINNNINNKTNTSSNETKLNFNNKKCNAITKQFTQCSRNTYKDTKFCQSHGNMLKNNKCLPQGTIYDLIESQQSSDKKINDKLDNLSLNNSINETILEKTIINDEEIFIDKSTNIYYKKDKNNKLIKIDKIDIIIE